MNSGTVGGVKRVAKPAARRRVYMDFAAQGKKPGPVTGGVSAAQRQSVKLQPNARAAQRQAARPAGPDARAAQANARIAQRKAQVEAQQRAIRLAKAGVPGRAPGLKTVAQPKVGAPVQPKVGVPAQARAGASTMAGVQAQPKMQRKFNAKPAAPEPQRPLSRGRVVKPRGAVQRTGVTVAQVADTPTGRLIEQETYEEIDFGVIEDYQGDAATTEVAPEMTPEVASVPEKGPNWPFLKSVTVEKRPLSGKKPVPTKTVAPRPTTVTPAASSIALNSGSARKGSKLPMVGLIILTIILGVAVGAAVYFAIFQGGGPEV